MERRDVTAGWGRGVRDGARQAGFAPWLIAAFAALLAFMPAARAQPAGPNPTPVIPGIYASATNASVATAFDLATKLLMSPNGRSTAPFAAPNPGGGGAGPEAATPRMRSWFETYGAAARTGAQGEFPGDKRETAGGVAGISGTIAPGVTLGATIDQSRSWIAVSGLPQNATLDLTQIGGNITVERGPWTATAGVIGAFGDIASARFGLTDPAFANYRANLIGVLGEASYFWGLGAWRIVPKAGIDYVYTHTGAFSENGGIDAAALTSLDFDRTRLFAGAEVGHTFVLGGGRLFDLSGYGRYYGTVARTTPQFTVSSTSGAFTPTTVNGFAESLSEGTAGASASLKVSDAVRVYAAYDGRFRTDFTSHMGTVGVEVRF